MTLQPAPASHLRAACSAEYLRYAPHLVVLALGLFIRTLHCMLASPAMTPQEMVLAAPQGWGRLQYNCCDADRLPRDIVAMRYD